MTVLTLENIDEGQDIPVLRRSPRAVDLVKFASVAEDFSRQHWDQPYMASLGFPDVIVHGWLTLTYMCQAVTACLPPEAARIIRYDARHLLPAFPGDMTVGGTIVRKKAQASDIVLELELWAKDAKENIVTRGNFDVVLL